MVPELTFVCARLSVLLRFKLVCEVPASFEMLGWLGTQEAQSEIQREAIIELHNRGQRVTLN
jgi:hypothetical protein